MSEQRHSGRRSPRTYTQNETGIQIQTDRKKNNLSLIHSAGKVAIFTIINTLIIIIIIIILKQDVDQTYCQAFYLKQLINTNSLTDSTVSLKT